MVVVLLADTVACTMRRAFAISAELLGEATLRCAATEFT